MKKHHGHSKKHPDGHRGHGNNQHPPSGQDQGSQKAAAILAKSRLEQSYGGAGAVARVYPGPWTWDDHGDLRDKKGTPIPGADRIRVKSAR